MSLVHPTPYLTVLFYLPLTGSYSIVDAITAAVVESASNGVSHVDVSTVGIQQLKFNIGVQDGSLSLERV